MTLPLAETTNPLGLNPPHTCTRWCVDHGDSDCYSAAIDGPGKDQWLSVGYTPAVNSTTYVDQYDLMIETSHGEVSIECVKLTPAQAAAIAEVFNHTVAVRGVEGSAEA